MEVSTNSNCISALESYLQVENEKNSSKKQNVSSLADSLRPQDTVNFSDEAKAKAIEMMEQKEKEDAEAEAQANAEGQGGADGAGGAGGMGGGDSSDAIESIEKAIAKAQQELGALISSDLPTDSKEARISTLQAKISQLTQELSALKAAAAKSA